MKFRPGKPTTLIIDPVRPSNDRPGPNPSIVDIEPTQVAPSPFVGPQQRFVVRRRPLLLVTGGLAILVVSFFIGVGISRFRQSMRPEPIEISALRAAPHLAPAPPSRSPGVAALAAAAIDPPPAGFVPSEELDLATATATVAATAPAPLAPPDTVLLSVTVSPPHAVVMLGADRLPSNPFVGRFPRSADTQRIRATAPGFQSREREVSFNDNVILDLSLSVLPVPHQRAQRRTLTPPRPSLAATLAPPPPKESAPAARRGIESKDPYLGDNPLERW